MIIPVFIKNRYYEERKVLSIYFGEKDDVMYGPAWFKYNYEQQWFEDEFVKEMLEDIDKSRFVGGELIQSEALGPIPPERLSGGLQTLISIYKNPNLMFDATSCGENCAKWLLKIGKEEDVSVDLMYIMPFDGFEPFEMKILNDDVVVNNYSDYVHYAIKYI